MGPSFLVLSDMILSEADAFVNHSKRIDQSSENKREGKSYRKVFIHQTEMILAMNNLLIRRWIFKR